MRKRRSVRTTAGARVTRILSCLRTSGVFDAHG
jgi:hypothetical protein